MHFDDLEARMRPHETASDRCVAADVYMVARLDGRGFTRLLTTRSDFDVPFDLRVRDVMIATTDHLMHCGFQVSYGYTQSDEISLLFRRDEATFGRKLHKLLSVLAGEASAKFTLLLGDLACFDCRISELADAELVVDYFRWRQADATRNALGAHCYWALRKTGASASEATTRLHGVGPAERRRLLASLGIDFDAVPGWQKYGAALHWERHEHDAVHARTGAPVQALRRRLRVELELPSGDAYAELVRDQVTKATAPEP